MNILIIEDDVYLSEKIQETFMQKAVINQIRKLHSYNDFLHESRLDIYDIILLDILLGEDTDKGGLQILEHVRKCNTTTPIIIMSSISDCCFLEKAFALGAHDYVIKPFRVRELQIRVQRWFHNYVFRECYNYETHLEYEGLLYYPHKNLFYYNDVSIQLSRANKYLLSLFMIHRDRLLTQTFLMEKIWGYTESISSKNLRIKIMRLKRQLEKEGIDHWIKTIRGEGYMLQKS